MHSTQLHKHTQLSDEQDNSTHSTPSIFFFIFTKVLPQLSLYLDNFRAIYITYLSRLDSKPIYIFDLLSGYSSGLHPVPDRIHSIRLTLLRLPTRYRIFLYPKFGPSEMDLVLNNALKAKNEKVQKTKQRGNRTEKIKFVSATSTVGSSTEALSADPKLLGHGKHGQIKSSIYKLASRFGSLLSCDPSSVTISTLLGLAFQLSLSWKLAALCYNRNQHSRG